MEDAFVFGVSFGAGICFGAMAMEAVLALGKTVLGKYVSVG